VHVTTDRVDVQPLNEAERAELEQLRAEIGRLRAGPARPGRRPPGAGRRRGRTAAAVVLILLGVLIAPLSVVAVWAKSQVTDTDRYVQTMAPLADDPAVQAAVTTDITNRIFGYIDVESLTRQGLQALTESNAVPPRVASQLDALAVPLANGIRSFTRDQVAKVVGSEAFAQAWTQANRAAHEQLVAALTGEHGGTVDVAGDTVSINVGPLIATVKQQLLQSGFTLADRIPVVNAQFTVFQSDQVTKARTGLNLLNTLGFWLPIIGLALLGAGAYVARDHRLALIGIGLGVAASMLLLGLVLAIVRSRYLDAVPPDRLPRDAASTLFDTVVRFLRAGLRAVAAAAVLLAAGAFLTGPSVTAVRLREVTVRAIAAVHRGVAGLGLPLSGVARWLGPRQRLFRILLVVATAVALIAWSYPTTAVVLWITVALLGGLALIQFLATPTAGRPEPSATPGPVPAG
jgi:hypothetical protein